MSSWEKNVRRVEPYIPGEQPKERNIIKLNTNENPFPPSPLVRKALAEAEADDLRLYPDPDCSGLRKALAGRFGVGKENVFVGVGSDDVLSTAFLTFFGRGGEVLFSDVTYSFYDVWCSVYGIEYKTIPLRPDFSLDSGDYTDGTAGGIVIANPNAPTGICERVGTIGKIVEANPQCVVIVDEAYIDFGGESCIPVIKEFDNLLVVQTFSKSRSLAGARIGYAVGCEKLIGYMLDVRNSINSYTMNRAALAVGEASLADEDYFTRCCEEIAAIREYSEKRLALLGFRCTDSRANFIFAAHKSVPAGEIFARLSERGIYVRHWNRKRISNYLRITVGTREQMEKLFGALGEIVGNI